MDIEQLLQQGIAAAKAGQRQEARKLLSQVVKANQQSEHAWMWLAVVLDDPEQQKTCLERVLKINPGNTRAQKGIASIQARHLPTAKQAASSATPSAHATSQQVSPKPQSQPAPPPPAKPTPPPPSPSPHIVEPSPQTTETTNQQTTHPATGLRSRLAKSGTVASDTFAQPPEKPASQIDNITALPSQKATQQASIPQTKPAQEKPAPTTATNPALVCPFCGNPTQADKHICPTCKKNLKLRTEPPERRSVGLSFMGGIWAIASIFIIVANFIWIGKNPMNAIPLIGGIISFGLAISLLQRRRWAYIVSIVIFLILCVFSIRYYFWLLMIPFFLFIVRSYRDFYPVKKRFVPIVTKKSHEEHYEAGVKYREKGMLYMATREWEAAIQQKPDFIAYRHALAVVYTKIDQVDRALAHLHQAREQNPNDTRTQEIIKTLEQQSRRQHA